MSRGNRRGVALLEVLIALVILSIAAESGIRLLIEASVQARRGALAERDVADQSRLLTAISLLTSGDLDARLGRRTAGPYKIVIERTSPSIYTIRVSNADGPESAALITMLYRRADSR